MNLGNQSSTQIQNLEQSLALHVAQCRDRFISVFERQVNRFDEKIAVVSALSKLTVQPR